MKYQPRTEKEMAEANLLPVGSYPFEVAEAVDTVSKTSGKPMLKLSLAVFDPEGNRHAVTDYIVPGNIFADKKLFEFMRAVGLGARYERGEVEAHELIGKGGWVKIGIEKGKAKDDGSGDFPDKNKAAWYSMAGPGPKTVAGAGAADPGAYLPSGGGHQAKAPEGIDEDVPF